MLVGFWGGGGRGGGVKSRGVRVLFIQCSCVVFTCAVGKRQGSHTVLPNTGAKLRYFCVQQNKPQSFSSGPLLSKNCFPDFPDFSPRNNYIFQIFLFFIPIV